MIQDDVSMHNSSLPLNARRMHYFSAIKVTLLGSASPALMTWIHTFCDPGLPSVNVAL